MDNEIICCHIWRYEVCETCGAQEPGLPLPDGADPLTYPRTVIGVVLDQPVDWE